MSDSYVPSEKDPSARQAEAFYDAIIIGGGPGGSTAGSALARGGKKVLILERERFPRFHVGESLIPFGNDELRSIGVWDKLEAGGFTPKLGAEFVLGNSEHGIRIQFNRHLPASYARTFQVERARFDHILLDHAAESGCEVWQEAKVESVSIADTETAVKCLHEGRKLTLRTRWLFDASGRDAFLGKQLQLPKTDLGMPKKFATFAHFHNVVRNEPPDDGHIVIVRLDFGWFWIIPLDAQKTSVGLVQTLEHFKQTGMTPAECFENVVATTTEMQKRLGQAKRVSDFNFAGDYTYRYLENAGPRWMLIGDAAGFIDPIFSSGVMLSIKSGFLAATEALAADRTGAPLSALARSRYTRKVGQMSKVFLNMIRMFYSRPSFEVFMTPKPDFQVERAIYNLVAGNTNLGWKLHLRVALFYALCKIQKYLALSPRLVFTDKAADGRPKPAGEAKLSDSIA